MSDDFGVCNLLKIQRLCSPSINFHARLTLTDDMPARDKDLRVISDWPWPYCPVSLCHSLWGRCKRGKRESTVSACENCQYIQWYWV